MSRKKYTSNPALVWGQYILTHYFINLVLLIQKCLKRGFLKTCKKVSLAKIRTSKNLKLTVYKDCKS